MTPSAQSPTTPNQYNLLRNTDIPSGDRPPKLSPSVQISTTPNQYNLLRNTDIPSGDRPPQIEPKCTGPYYMKPVQPIEKYRHTQCRETTQSSPSVQSPTTPNQYNLLRNTDISSVERTPYFSLSVQSPTTPNQYNLLRNEEVLPC